MPKTSPRDCRLDLSLSAPSRRAWRAARLTLRCSRQPTGCSHEMREFEQCSEVLKTWRCTQDDRELDLGALFRSSHSLSMPPNNPPPYSVDTPPYPATTTAEGEPRCSPVDYYYYPAGFHRRRRTSLSEFDEVEMCWLIVFALFVPFSLFFGGKAAPVSPEWGLQA
jgi:hypothetical protein